MSGVTADTVVVDLQAKVGTYIRNINDARQAFANLKAELQGGSPTIDKAVEVSAVKQTRVRKKAADDQKAIVAKQIADEKAASAERIRIAEAEDKRFAELAERAAQRGRVKPGSGRNIGATVPREKTGQSIFVDSAAATVVAEEAEINHLLIDRITDQALLTVAKGKERDILKDQLTYLSLIDRYQKAGLGETEAAILAQETLEKIEKRRAVNAKKPGLQLGQTGRFLEAAGLGRTGGGAAAIGGLVTAAAIGATVALIEKTVEYGKALESTSQELGISTKDLQVYQAAANAANVTQEQLRTGLGTLSTNLGKAQEGSKEQAKVFKALGISIKGVSSAGDLLPTLVQRISSIKDPAQRAAVETRLFGEEGRKLDPILSGGIAKINELSDALEHNGSILSKADIEKLSEIGAKFAEIKTAVGTEGGRAVAAFSDEIIVLANAFETLVKVIGDAVAALGHFFNSATGKAIGSGINDAFEAITGFPLSELYQASQEKNGGKSGKGGPVQGGSVNSKLLSSLGAPAGKSAETLEKERLERDKRFNDTIAKFQDEEEAADAKTVASEQERRDLARKKLDRDEAKAIKDLQDQAAIDIKNGANGALTQSRLAEEIAAKKAATLAEKNAINLEANLSTLDRTAAFEDRISEVKKTELENALVLADTAKERREIELKLLDIATDQEKAAAQLVLDRAAQGKPTSDLEIAAANATIKNADAKRAGAIGVVKDRTRGPGETYLDSLPTTADKVDEAFQRAAVGGLEAFDNKLSSSIDKMLHLHGLAGQLLSDIIKIGLEKEIVAPIANALFGGSGGGSSGGGGSGFVSTALTAISSFFGGGHATGGPVQAGKLYKVNEFGTEGFRPSGSGQIIPLGQMKNTSGGSQILNRFSIDLRGARTDEQTMAQIAAYVDDQNRRLASGILDTVKRGQPPQQARYNSLGTTG